MDCPMGKLHLQIAYPVNTLLAVEEVKLKMMPNHILCSEDY